MNRLHHLMSWKALKPEYKAYSCLIFICLMIFSHTQLYAGSVQDALRERLRNRIESPGYPPTIQVNGELIHATIVLPLFYERRGYDPVWLDSKGQLLPIVNDLVNSIASADYEGLNSDNYHLGQIRYFIDEIANSSRIINPDYLTRAVSLELLLTDGFLILGSHYLAGRVNPQTFDPEWFANQREADMAQVLQNAIDSSSVSKSLNSLLPQQEGYRILKEKLQQFVQLNESNKLIPVPGTVKLQINDKNDRVILLCNILKLYGDLKSDTRDSLDSFDSDLESAVKTFQTRHGLEADGVVGKATLKALNTPLEDHIDQIKINMERWRWLPQNFGKRYVIINIANFELKVVENNENLMTKKIIVGRDYRRTPVFSDKISYLVFNPSWHIPFNLAVKDILPLARKNPEYFAQKKIKIFQGQGINQKEIDPKTIDWFSYSASRFPFQLRQEPGAENALGVVKFMLPNQFNVYLHDTPAKELFSKTERAFSSGCIRIQNPLDLAEYLLSDNKGWSKDKIAEVIKVIEETTVKLTNPIPVHILYWTAWVDKLGAMQFRNDIYGRDELLLKALDEKPPTVS